MGRVWLWWRRGAGGRFWERGCRAGGEKRVECRCGDV